MTRVLVAGATGYLGRFVAREFKRRGHCVRALARSPAKLDDLRGELDEIVRAEVTRPETLSHVRDGIDVVFSSVGMPSGSGKWGRSSTNATSTPTSHLRSGFTKRSRVEDVIYRHKVIVGREMKARTLAGQRAEARPGCRIINKMAKLGMSQSHRAA